MRVITLLVFLVAFALVQPLTAQTAASCAPAGNIQFVCGQEGPEDLLHLPGSDWVIASSLGGNGGIRFSVIISVDTPEAVDELAAQVRAAGGTLTKPPVDPEFFEGRDAYFSDPEGNFWEIAYAPADNPVVIASRRAAGLHDA